MHAYFRLKQEPLSSCAFVTYASIKVASHSELKIQWLSEIDLIGIPLPCIIFSFFVLLYSFLFVFLALCSI